MGFGKHALKFVFSRQTGQKVLTPLTATELRQAEGRGFGFRRPTLKLNPDTSVVSSGLKNSISQYSQGCQHAVFKITIQISILAKKQEKQKLNNVCIFAFFALKFSQAGLPRFYCLKCRHKITVESAVTMLELQRTRLCPKSQTQIILLEPPVLLQFTYFTDEKNGAWRTNSQHKKNIDLNKEDLLRTEDIILHDLCLIQCSFVIKYFELWKFTMKPKFRQPGSGPGGRYYVCHPYSQLLASLLKIVRGRSLSKVRHLQDIDR